MIATTDYLDDDTGLPQSDILRFDVAGGGRVMLRPSGTEPKLKVYVELVVPASDQFARQTLDALVADARDRSPDAPHARPNCRSPASPSPGTM